jgi:hypothetical protein
MAHQQNQRMVAPEQQPAHRATLIDKRALV